MHLHIARLRTRRGPCSTQRCRPQPIAAGHLVAHPAACKAAGVPAPLARLARRLRADRGGPEAPQVARGRCCYPLPSASFFPVPVIRGPWGSCVCRMPLAGLQCRASSRLPASSQVRPAWPGAAVGFQPGRAWLRVAVRLSRAFCSRPAPRERWCICACIARHEDTYRYRCTWQLNHTMC